MDVDQFQSIKPINPYIRLKHPSGYQSTSLSLSIRVGAEGEQSTKFTSVLRTAAEQNQRPFMQMHVHVCRNTHTHTHTHTIWQRTTFHGVRSTRCKRLSSIASHTMSFNPCTVVDFRGNEEHFKAHTHSRPRSIFSFSPSTINHRIFNVIYTLCRQLIT